MFDFIKRIFESNKNAQKNSENKETESERIAREIREEFYNSVPECNNCLRYCPRGNAEDLLIIREKTSEIVQIATDLVKCLPVSLKFFSEIGKGGHISLMVTVGYRYQDTKCLNYAMDDKFSSQSLINDVKKASTLMMAEDERWEQDGTNRIISSMMGKM